MAEKIDVKHEFQYFVVESDFAISFVFAHFCRDEYALLLNGDVADADIAQFV